MKESKAMRDLTPVLKELQANLHEDHKKLKALCDQRGD